MAPLITASPRTDSPTPGWPAAVGPTGQPLFMPTPARTTQPGADGDGHRAIDLGDATRLAIMATPASRGAFAEQAAEVLDTIQSALRAQPHQTSLTTQTIFLRQARDRDECQRLFAQRLGTELPVTNYVLQPPCCGAALAVEAWAIGGQDVQFERFGPHTLAVSYHGTRWVHVCGVEPTRADQDVHAQALEALGQTRAQLETAGTRFENVVRTWLYLGDITGSEGATQRYKELNRARTDFYRDLAFGRSLRHPGAPECLYPASTGIGVAGRGLLISALALETRRDDVWLLPLENPQQTPAYDYRPDYSPQSPKFSRAMALVLGGYVTSWISGTASILQSESRHLDDIERQTDQTLDNIEQLIAPENFSRHGLPGAGATLRDLAKVRVYVKRPADFDRCRAVCQRRLGAVPAIYAAADVCRPELLVEIEGVAFSRNTPRPVTTPPAG